MASKYNATTLQGVISEKIHLLNQFTVKYSPAEVTATITKLYPNDVAIENYIHTLIVSWLDYLDDKSRA